MKDCNRPPGRARCREPLPQGGEAPSGSEELRGRSRLKEKKQGRGSGSGVERGGSGGKARQEAGSVPPRACLVLLQPRDAKPLGFVFGGPSSPHPHPLLGSLANKVHPVDDEIIATFLPQHALPGILPWAPPRKLPAWCLRPKEVENTRLQREQGSPGGEQNYSKGCCKPQVLETAPPTGHAWQRAGGCSKRPRTCPEHVNVVVQDRAMQNMTWQAVGRSALMSCQPAGITASSALPWGEIGIAGRRLCDRRAPR